MSDEGKEKKLQTSILKNSNTNGRKDKKLKTQNLMNAKWGQSSCLGLFYFHGSYAFAR